MHSILFIIDLYWDIILLALEIRRRINKDRGGGRIRHWCNNKRRAEKSTIAIIAKSKGRSEKLVNILGSWFLAWAVRSRDWQDGIVQGARAAGQPLPGGRGVAYLGCSCQVRIGSQGLSGSGVEWVKRVRREALASGVVCGGHWRLHWYVHRVLLLAASQDLYRVWEDSQPGPHERFWACGDAAHVLPLWPRGASVRENQVSIFSFSFLFEIYTCVTFDIEIMQFESDPNNSQFVSWVLKLAATGNFFIGTIDICLFFPWVCRVSCL